LSDDITLPRDCTTEQARELIGKQVGSLRREIGALQQKSESMQRINQRLMEENAALSARIEEWNDKFRELSASKGDAAAVARLTGERDRWRGIAEFVYGALGLALREAAGTPESGPPVARVPPTAEAPAPGTFGIRSSAADAEGLGVGAGDGTGGVGAGGVAGGR
jgi:regulator of replication initiation timing